LIESPKLWRRGPQNKQTQKRKEKRKRRRKTKNWKGRKRKKKKKNDDTDQKLAAFITDEAPGFFLATVYIGRMDKEKRNNGMYKNNHLLS
jgi:transposase